MTGQRYWLALTIVVAGPLVAASQESSQAEEVDGPCGWSMRWDEINSTKPVKVDKSISLEKIEDARIEWPFSEIGRSGVPMLQYVIEPGGTIEEIRFIRKPAFRPPWPEADQAILDAMYQWGYEPTIVNGVAVPVCVTMMININWS